MNRRDLLKTLGISVAGISLPLRVCQNVEKSNDSNTCVENSISYKERIINTLVENQRLHNPDLIPQIRNIFDNTCLWDWISIQPARRNLLQVFKLENLNGYRKEIKSVKVEITKRFNVTNLDWEIIKEIESCCSERITTWDFDSWNLWPNWTIKPFCDGLMHLIAKTSFDANNIITSSEIASVLESITIGYKHNSVLKSIKSKIVESKCIEGFVKSGDINNRWRLYKKENIQSDIALIHAGTSWLDRVCVFTPCYLEDENTLIGGFLMCKPHYFNLIHVVNMPQPV
jgi:hypothetical protein